ncbi:MAG: hypothetical protein LC808_21810, partial [Actinobacteria bacterium]|nr:hypothetical protein [Actinomycetota bacterium]
PSLSIDPSVEYLAVPDVFLRRSAVPPKIVAAPKSGQARPNTPPVSPGPAAVETDPQVRALLRDASGLPRLAAADLRRFNYQFYAIVVGRDPGHRPAFVRKTNPASVVKSGRLMFAYGERLTQVTDPLLLLDERLDLVVLDEGLLVLHQPTFDLLFRDTEALATRYPIYASAFVTLGLGEEQIAGLVNHCRRDSRLSSRLRQIYESGHLGAGNVTTKNIDTQIKQLGLDRSRFFVQGRLDFSGPDATTLLKLLNDDLFIGGLSKVAYEAGSKSRST